MRPKKPHRLDGGRPAHAAAAAVVVVVVHVGVPEVGLGGDGLPGQQLGLLQPQNVAGGDRSRKKKKKNIFERVEKGK